MDNATLDELRLQFRVTGTIAPRTGLMLPCWLKQFDPLSRPCEGPLQAFHFLGRQRIRNALFAALPYCGICAGKGCGACDLDVLELTELAQWDPRNAGPACEMHHSRLDSHATPALVVFREKLPGSVEAFAADWGLEGPLTDKYPQMGAEDFTRCANCGDEFTTTEVESAVETDEGYFHARCAA
jgi:hypothetical protein